MNDTIIKPESYQRRQQELEGWQVGIVSYKLGEKFFCEIDNVSPGARLVRRTGETREEAESAAIDKASKMLCRTRTFPTE